MRALGLFLATAVLWTMWSGYFTPLLLGLGALSCLLVVGLARRMETLDDEGVPLHLLPRACAYAPWLLKEILLANVDVVRRIVRGRRATSPKLFEAPSTQRTDLGRAIFANSITLTPGTVSFDVEPGRIHVHAVAREVRDGLLEGGMDARCTKVEGGGA